MMISMDEQGTASENLQEEIRNTEEAIDNEIERLLPEWQVSIGRLNFSSAIGSEGITVIYVLFNSLCFILGVIFILLGGVLQVLGVALVVGGLFSFGAFVVQFWAIAVQRENEITERAIGNLYEEESYEEIRRLLKEYRDLNERLKSQLGSGDKRKSPPTETDGTVTA
jgi:hypothetical protein